MEFTFTLKYRLPDISTDAGTLEQQLAEAGCDDALLGIGRPGRLALEFCRQAASAQDAVLSALADVRQAVPGAELIEVSPDLVGLTDVADLLGMSRQNMRKLLLAHPQTFPAPVHEGSASIWHLADVLSWLQSRGSQKVSSELLELAAAALKVNVAKEQERLLRQPG
ncbi:DNA-binding protein [Stenotrophomonas sp. ESTM1D_MKCIP4_1]|uniref:helix-turn-helix transcriptional regulator n=1 Tax=Stenotrophomonas sp. ESTM1D_MKCIP4_1 TaxID=2072414 RepID=UPI000D53D103|nr:DNA-binding protein [Stenotrophomonas sp. ESTM1D_MKCIP4_1]AWH55453.1 DNA-binding protein [Stenotrophomonas sp. ESTM1D_MKCIP4_1]